MSGLPDSPPRRCPFAHWPPPASSATAFEFVPLIPPPLLASCPQDKTSESGWRRGRRGGPSIFARAPPPEQPPSQPPASSAGRRRAKDRPKQRFPPLQLRRRI